MKNLMNLESIASQFRDPQAFIPNPTIIEATPKGERQYDIYSRLLIDRIIYLGTEVTPASANLIITQLLYLDSQDSEKPIHLYINSPGGSVYAGLGIYDMMQQIKAPVHTYCVGMAASMASILLAAGSKGKRVSMPNSRIMIHQPLGGTGGSTQSTDMEIATKEIVAIREKLYSIYEAHNTKGKKIADFNVLCDRDNYLTPEAAIELGLLDAVVKSGKLADLKSGK